MKHMTNFDNHPEQAKEVYRGRMAEGMQNIEWNGGVEPVGAGQLRMELQLNGKSD
jgi:hypothetical protein